MRTYLKASSAAVMAVLGLAVFAPAAVHAQERRPYRGIFNVPPDPNKSHSLVLSGSLFGAYDDNVLSGITEGRVRDWVHQQSGWYGGATAGLGYAFARSGKRVSFGANSSAQLRYYDRGGDSHTAKYYTGGLNMSARLTRSTTFTASQMAAFMPGYSFLVPGFGNGLDGLATEEPLVDVEMPVDPDLEVFRLESFHLSSRLALTQRLSRGTTLTGGYGYRQVNFRGEDSGTGQFRDYGTHSGFARLSYQRGLTQYSTLNMGYGVRVSDRRDRSGRPRVLHNVQAGINYGRPLSFSRRTSLSFSTGSSIAVREDLSNPDSGPAVRARLTGNASLVHELGRTWTARATYRRGLTFREGFDDYFFTDRASVGVDGLVSRRLSFSAVGAWSLSRLDRPGRNRHTAFSGSAQATYGLTSYIGMFARYLYYDYDFGEDLPLDDRFPRALERHAVRVGISTSIPLIR